MNNEKKIYESAEIKIVKLDRDSMDGMFVKSGGALTNEDDWDEIGFGEF